MRPLAFVFAFIIASLFLVPVNAGEIRISAAASLKEVISELSATYAASHPAVRVLQNLGGSGTLAKQLENGAPADIYISANREWLDYLKKRNLVTPSSEAIFAYNTLVFAGGRTVGGMQDLSKLDRIAIGSPKSVPAGEYAMEAIEKAGLSEKLGKRLVFAKDVREALLYAERGEVDGAFVYRSDALLSKNGKIQFTVPQALYSRVTYPMALTVAGAKNNEAAGFYLFLKSAAAQTVLEKHGFAIR